MRASSTSNADIMEREVADLLEHLDRYRAVTLQALDSVEAGVLAWRPGPDYYSLCQQFIHIAQAEDFHSHGLFEEDWNVDRVRLPKECWDRERIRSFFETVRAFTRPHVEALSRTDLDRVLTIPGTPGDWTARSWLWFILEHELHQKGQIWLYLRQIGITPPFYAMPLENGQRPDIAARQELGGF
jgi:uncharacterized damage-inducible protein DinB